MAKEYIFALSHSSGSQQISEPGGWDEIKLILDRDKEYHTLIEHFEVTMIFYGNNGEYDGGKDFIESIEELGPNEVITFTVDIRIDNRSIDRVYTGVLDFTTLREIDERKIECAVIRDDFWAKFKNRIDSPVDILSDTDLDGNPVDVIDHVRINLPSQKVRQQYQASNSTSIQMGTSQDYFNIDFDVIVLDEIKEKYNYPVTWNTERPFELFALEYGGDYLFESNITLGFFTDDASESVSTSSRYDVYIQVNEESPIAFSKASRIVDSNYTVTDYTYNDTLTLVKGDFVRIYVELTGSYDLPNFLHFIGPNGPSINGVPAGLGESYLNVTADTVSSDSTAEGFLIHDVGYEILKRITGQAIPMYSPFLGGINTVSRQYAENGCGWRYALLKGLHVRGYTLDQKQHSTSFQDWWNGLNPIFNCALGYETVDGVQVITITTKEEVYDPEPSLYLSWVNNIERSYDKEYIIKKVVIGYEKWQGEDIAGLDDPQTKHTYTTVYETIGRELTLNSKYIAASLALEITRRKTIEKSADYKYDNETFIIALNPTPGGSPEGFDPELTENFDSITGLLNPDSRYNMVLTPKRNLLRWANLINGCLKSYPASVYKFVYGEGNYDMSSDYDCVSGIDAECPGMVCDDIGEGENLDLATYWDTLGYIFQPVLYTFEHPLSWEDYKTIRDNKNNAIAISRTDGNHETCFIKRLEYDINRSKAKFEVWKR